MQTELVKPGVSPHAPYTVSAPQLTAIAEYAKAESLPLMMHAAESEAENRLLCEGAGLFADNLKTRGIVFNAPRCSPIQHLFQSGILECRPLLAHCIRVDDEDIETLAKTGSKVAHCPKSNAKLRHGRAPFAKFLRNDVTVGLGTDSVASNNTCDILEEARFAALLSRTSAEDAVDGRDVLQAATIGGARCLELENQVGELRSGQQADLTVLSLGATHQLPVYDPIATTVFSSSANDVVLTVVAGREVFRDNEVVGVDEERLRRRMEEIAQKLTSN